jgi:hypothetical protein
MCEVFVVRYSYIVRVRMCTEMCTGVLTLSEGVHWCRGGGK